MKQVLIIAITIAIIFSGHTLFASNHVSDITLYDGDPLELLWRYYLEEQQANISQELLQILGNLDKNGSLNLAPVLWQEFIKHTTLVGLIWSATFNAETIQFFDKATNARQSFNESQREKSKCHEWSQQAIYTHHKPAKH